MREEPYPDLDNPNTIVRVVAGYRMNLPSDLNITLRLMIEDCWRADPAERPSMQVRENSIFIF